MLALSNLGPDCRCKARGWSGEGSTAGCGNIRWRLEERVFCIVDTHPVRAANCLQVCIKIEESWNVQVCQSAWLRCSAEASEHGLRDARVFWHRGLSFPCGQEPLHFSTFWPATVLYCTTPSHLTVASNNYNYSLMISNKDSQVRYRNFSIVPKSLLSHRTSSVLEQQSDLHRELDAPSPTVMATWYFTLAFKTCLISIHPN